MTLIECFDQMPVKNIVGCLRLQPEKVAYLGDEDLMRGPVELYRTFFRNRGMDTKVILRNVCMDSIDQITEAIRSIVRSENECVIDVTGGDERVLMAVGAVLAELDEKMRHRIDVQKFELYGDFVQDLDGDGYVISGQRAAMTSAELIALHGGTVHPRSEQPEHCYTPRDIQRVWELVCRDSKRWNRAIATLNEFESRSEDKTEIYLPLDSIESRIDNFQEKETIVRELLEDLHNCGVIDDRSSYDTLCYTYQDPFLHYCVKKAGNMLETKTLLEARGLREQGKPFFHDCQMSVTIDWDGIVHDPSQRKPETRNEVDLILMRGMVPLFVSCKNGNIEEEELYKLNTVASRFGSRYARKMLIATELDSKSKIAKESFIQRAKDMNVYLVKDAAKLTSEDWKRVLKEAMDM